MTPIDIPGKTLHDVSFAVGGIIMAALQEEGIDPRKAAAVPMMRELVRAWAHGEMDEDQFRRSCRNLLVLNPGLATLENNTEVR